MNYEYVYIFTNPAMPEWIKVGKTKNIQQRLKELNCTSVPLPFTCYAYLKVPEEYVFSAETSLHNFIGYANDKEKEFFRMSPEKAFTYFENLQMNNHDYELVKTNGSDQKIKTQIKKKEKTTFKLLKISKGSVLALASDSSVTCKVVDDKNAVLYKDKKTTLSAIACDLLNRSVNGFECFVYPSSEYPDETLWERRERLENLSN